MRESVVIGTRGSKLALWQAQAVKEALIAAWPGLSVEVQVVSTKGDRILDKPLEQIGDKGLFTKELEAALLAGEVDLCVHSMKDMPAELPAGCGIVAMLPRADVRDVLVCGPRIAGCASLAQLPAGTRLGTGSLRRTAQLRAAYPHVEPLPMRGNVDTRLAKAQGADYDGAVLAAAGVTRMGQAAQIAAYLPLQQMVPAVGQGAIGIEARLDDARIARYRAAIDDAPTHACVDAERAVLAALEGGCQVPIGAHARFEGDEVAFDAVVLSLDGAREARVSRRAAADADLLALAAQVVDGLRAGGADAILAEIRESEVGR